MRKSTFLGMAFAALAVVIIGAAIILWPPGSPKLTMLIINGPAILFDDPLTASGVVILVIGFVFTGVTWFLYGRHRE